MKPVHIELSHKRGHVGVFVVVRQHLFCKLIVVPAYQGVFKRQLFKENLDLMRKEVPSSDHPISASVSGLSTIFHSLARKAGTLPAGCCGMIISITGSWFILDFLFLICNNAPNQILQHYIFDFWKIVSKLSHSQVITRKSIIGCQEHLI